MPSVASGKHLENLIGHSTAILRVKNLIQKLGSSRVPVLLLGESGTGKEVAANAIYNVRTQGAFVPIDCSALPSHLIESELFGHERGAFTGAHTSRVGLLEQAHGGTAFLDEVGELPLDMQAKLLRALQQQQIRPVGSNRSRSCSFRIIAATNRDLRKEVEKGRFRLDLYYRLDVVSLELPPLRSRREDIPLLVEHFLKEDGGAWQIEPGLIEALMKHDWQGNVRELQNCIARLIALTSDEYLHVNDLPHGFGESHKLSDNLVETDGHIIPGVPGAANGGKSLADTERRAIEEALLATNGNRAAVASRLGIGRTTLYRRLKQYGTG